MSFNIKAREAWWPTDVESLEPLNYPIPFVVYRYINLRHFRMATTDCCKQMYEFVTNDMNRMGISDIRYNFMLGRDGNIYEARGWSAMPILPQEMSHELEGLALYVGIMGKIGENKLPDEIIKAKDALINYGLQENLLDKKYISYLAKF